MARRVDDSLVILDVQSGRYFELNDVGALLWDGLEKPTDVDSLVDAVTSAYDIDRATALDDVEHLLASLLEAGLITIDP